MTDSSVAMREIESRPDASPAIGRHPVSVGIALAGAIVVGTAIRVASVGDQSLGYEEIFTLSVVSRSSLAGVWHAVRATESTPPLYYVITWLWTKVLASDSAVVLRLTSLLAGCLTVPMAFLAMRRFFDRRVALVVAWLCAISPELLDYAIYARSYALLVLLATASVWALGRLLEAPSRRWWGLWAVIATGCLWTHYFAIFLIAAEAGVLATLLPRLRRSLLLALAGIAAATAVLWPLLLAQNGAADRTAYIAATPLSTRLVDTVRQFAMGSNVPRAALEGAGIVVVVLAALFAAARTARSRSTRVLIGLVLVGGGVPILIAALGVRDVFLPRNILGVWICLAALAGYGLVRLRAAPLILYTVICLVTVAWTQTNWRYQGQVDWSGAGARLPRTAAPDPVAVLSGNDIIVAAHYLRRVPLEAPEATRDLWVIVEPARAAHERGLTPVPNPPLAQLWGTQFSPQTEIDYRGFRLIHLHAATPVEVLPRPANDGRTDSPLALVLAPG